MRLLKQIVQVYEQAGFSNNALCDMKYLHKCAEHQGLQTHHLA